MHMRIISFSKNKLKISILLIQKEKAVHEESFETFADCYSDMFQLKTLTVVRKSHKLKCDIRALQGLVFLMSNDVPHYTPMQCQAAIPFRGISSQAKQPSYSPVNFKQNISSRLHKEEHHREGLRQLLYSPAEREDPTMSSCCRSMQPGDEFRHENMQQEAWGCNKLLILLSDTVRPNWERLFLT